MLVYVRARREALGMTQGDLAEKVGVSRGAVSLWESGLRNPETWRLPALAAALGCKAGELFAPSDNQVSTEEAG